MIQLGQVKKADFMGEMEISHAKKLRYLRKKHDFKQVDLANHLGLSQQAYSKLENGETSFSDETIEKISDFFKITPADFERPFENMMVGNNSMNHDSTIHLIDAKVLDVLDKMYQQNSFLIEQNKLLIEEIINEKNLRILSLEDSKK